MCQCPYVLETVSKVTVWADQEPRYLPLFFSQGPLVYRRSLQLLHKLSWIQHVNTPFCPH